MDEHWTPHDSLFKAVFSDAENAFAILRAALPPALVEAIDPASLEEQSGTFIDLDLRHRYADLLFRAMLKGRETLVYVLLEHQSTVERLMPFRMLRSVTRIWDRWLAKNPSATALPPVIPVILHQGPRGWTGPRRLSEIVELPPDLVGELRPHVPDFEIAFEELGKRDADALARRVPSAAALALVLLKAALEEPGILETLEARAGPLIQDLLSKPAAERVVGQLAMYIVCVAGAPRETVFREIGRWFGPEVREMGKSMMQIETEQAFEAGGKSVLVRQLRAKFGEVPPEVQGRIDRAPVSDVERWADRILTASRLEDVFA